MAYSQGFGMSKVLLSNSVREEHSWLFPLPGFVFASAMIWQGVIMANWFEDVSVTWHPLLNSLIEIPIFTPKKESYIGCLLFPFTHQQKQAIELHVSKQLQQSLGSSSNK